MHRTSAAMLALLLAGACRKDDAASKGPAPGDRAVPVALARVEQKDVSIYLDGLGTVSAYKTVTVRARVDGLLLDVRFREGQQVRAGDVLAQIDPRPFEVQLHQAEAALARDLAQLRTSKLALERNLALLREGLVSQQQVDDLQAQVGQYEGAVGIDRASIESAKLNLSWSTVRSPIDGITGIRSVDPGNLVRATDTNGLVVLTEIDPVAVIFTLPQDVLPQVAARQREEQLPVEVYGRSGDQKLGEGRLEVIDNQINAGTATLRLKGVLPNPERRLWPNQFVKARLLLSVRNGALVIPASAIQRGPDGTFVYVVGADLVAQPRPVQVDLTQGNDAIVAKGLSPGEQVVIEGQSQLKPGSKVAPKGAAEKPAPAAAAQKNEARQPPRGREAVR